MSTKLMILVTLTVTVVLPCLAEDSAVDPQQSECKSMSSCSSCISKSFCVWCVTKSKCTKQSCGNDNIIYPKHTSALMAGPSFCPRVVDTDVKTIKSGKKETIIVKITQIHLYMSFTPWKCKININGEEIIVTAMLLGDNVFCDSVLFENKANNPSVSGSVSVLWDYSKSFDGSIPIKVCRCDLDPHCMACIK